MDKFNKSLIIFDHQLSDIRNNARRDCKIELFMSLGIKQDLGFVTILELHVSG